jgi:hypothetical protein
MLNMEMKRLEDVGGADSAVREHMGKDKVQTLMPEEVVLVCDAMGRSAGGQGERT